MDSAVARRDLVEVDVMLVNDAKQILDVGRTPRVAGGEPKGKG
ncbi:MAG: hypothetical protein ACK557_24315 [Planctomycetota bacterium]